MNLIRVNCSKNFKSQLINCFQFLLNLDLCTSLDECNADSSNMFKGPEPSLRCRQNRTPDPCIKKCANQKGKLYTCGYCNEVNICICCAPLPGGNPFDGDEDQVESTNPFDGEDDQEESSNPFGDEEDEGPEDFDVNAESKYPFQNPKKIAPPGYSEKLSRPKLFQKKEGKSSGPDIRRGPGCKRRPNLFNNKVFTAPVNNVRCSIEDCKNNNDPNSYTKIIQFHKSDLTCKGSDDTRLTSGDRDCKKKCFQKEFYCGFCDRQLECTCCMATQKPAHYGVLLTDIDFSKANGHYVQMDTCSMESCKHLQSPSKYIEIHKEDLPERSCSYNNGDKGHDQCKKYCLKEQYACGHCTEENYCACCRAFQWTEYTSERKSDSLRFG